METLADGNGFGDAQIDLEEAGRGEAIAAEIAVATRGRADAGNREGGAIIGEGSSGPAEGDTGNEGRSGPAADRWTGLRSAEVEACVRAGDDVVWAAGGDFYDRRDSETAEETSREAVAALALRALEDGAGDPTMALVVHGIRALKEREAGVLRLERRLQVGGVVDRMRIGVTREQLKRVREALGEIECQSVVPGVAIGKLSVNAIEGHGNAEATRIACGFREGDLRSVAPWDQPGEGRVGSGGAEKIEEGRSSNKADRRAAAILARIAQSENSRREGMTSWRRKRDASAS